MTASASEGAVAMWEDPHDGLHEDRVAWSVTQMRANHPVRAACERRTEPLQGVVAVVDHIPAFGTGLAAILEREGFEVVRPSRPLSRLRRKAADAVFVTVQPMPGLEKLRTLSSAFPDVVIIAVLLSTEYPDHQRALRSGAHATVGWCASSGRDRPGDAVGSGGQTVLPTSVARALAESAPERRHDSALSADDIQWLRTLAPWRVRGPTRAHRGIFPTGDLPPACGDVSADGGAQPARGHRAYG